MANTKPMMHKGTKPMVNMISADRLQLVENVIFEGENDSYEIMVDSIIGVGGESIVYKAERVSDKKIVAAKIYDQYIDSPSNDINRDKVIRFLLDNLSYKDTNILPLYDYGTIIVKSETGKNYSKPIDIIPVCESEQNKRLDYQTLRNKFIPQVLNAINIVHKADFIHRDIKPENIYLFDDVYVIADFGTANTVEHEAKYHGTQRARGTVEYSAPEIRFNYAKKASDYYSFGCTIATVYKGEHVWQELVNANDYAALSQAMYGEGFPLKCNEYDADLQILVDALTIASNVDERAGYEDVQLWLKSPLALKRKFENKTVNQKNNFEVVFKNQTYHDKKELSKGLALNWEDARTYLFRGGVNNSALVSAINKYDNGLAHDIMGAIEENDSKERYDLGLAKTLYYICGENAPLYWKSYQFGSLSDVSKAIFNNEVSVEYIESLLLSKYISWRMEKRVDDSTLQQIRKIEEIAEKYPKIAYYIAMYAFNNGEYISQGYNGKKSLREIFLMDAKTIVDFYELATRTIKDEKLLAYLCSSGYWMQAIKYRDSLTGKLEQDLERWYIMFESICQDKKHIREHYLLYGPKSYLYWIKENIKLYEFNTAKAVQVKNNILSIEFFQEDTILELAKKLNSLDEYVKEMKLLFDDNILLLHLGLSNKNSEVSSNNSDAYFLAEFCGYEVPMGYYRYVKRKQMEI